MLFGYRAPIGLQHWDEVQSMRPEFRRLRIKQIDRALIPFAAAKDSPRPQTGWLRAVREATGITPRQIAARLKKAPSLVGKLEKSEPEYRITLGSLREAADAPGCQLVYALVPRHFPLVSRIYGEFAARLLNLT